MEKNYTLVASFMILTENIERNVQRREYLPPSAILFLYHKCKILKEFLNGMGSLSPSILVLFSSLGKYSLEFKYS